LLWFSLKLNYNTRFFFICYYVYFIWLFLLFNNLVIGYQIPKLSYKNKNGVWVAAPDVIQGKRTIDIIPSGYDSISGAVEAYCGGYSVPQRATVDGIRISGPESKVVQTIYPCNPQFPLHCE